MKIEYIRNKKDIDNIISKLEEKNVNVKTNLKGENDKLSKLYLYAPLEKLYFPSELGLEGDYGGRVHKIAKIKDTDVYLLCDGMNNGIGMFRYVEEEKKEVKKEEYEEEETFGQKMAKIRAEKKKQEK